MIDVKISYFESVIEGFFELHSRATEEEKDKKQAQNSII
tara:strand:- start:2605 stop:2721 length:117 start_codon:yes stop_codon:yes gene_type:complete